MPATPVELAVVRALLDEQAPELAGLPLAPLDGGMDNAVVRLGDQLLVRLPRTPAAAVLLENEQRWLPVLAPLLPLPVPAPVVAGRPGAGFGHPWSVVPWVEGRTADVAAARPDRFAGALAGFLGALHVPAPPGAPGNPMRGVPLAARLPRHAQALEGHPRARRLLAELEQLAEVPEATGPRVWVHGDLHPRNVVVRRGRLTGVIDFGDLHAGDRAVDLAGLWMLLPPLAREQVLAALGTDEATRERARGWALVLGAMLRMVGLREADAGFRLLGERALDAACPPCLPD